MEKKLEDLNVTELKALVYDEVGKSEQAQRNVKVLNELISQKIQNEQVDPKSTTGTEPVDMNTNKSGTHETNNS